MARCEESPFLKEELFSWLLENLLPSTNTDSSTALSVLTSTADVGLGRKLANLGTAGGSF